MSGAADKASRPDYPDSSGPIDQADPAPDARRSVAEQRAGRRDQILPPDQSADHSPTRLQQRLDHLPDGHPSSPRNDDGTQRAPTVRLRDLELPDDDTPSDTNRTMDTLDQPSIAETTEDTATDRGENTTSDAWRKEEPAFRAAWENHLEQWPGTDRNSPHRADGELGFWRSDAGHSLNREQIKETENAFDKIKENELKVTRMMKAVETAVPGVHLAGLDNRLKGEDRFKEKVAYESNQKPDRSIAEIIDRIPDKIRYTCQLSAGLYTEGYWGVHTHLVSQGNELILSRNSWPESEYKGINTRWLSTDGDIFEVQFHTADSFEAKQLTHNAYERLRSGTELGAEGPFLENFQRTVTSKVEIPDRATTIPNYRREGF